MKTFKVLEFGAVGNGIQNDGLAICRAVNAALTCGEDAQIIFEAEHEKNVYYISEIPVENEDNCLFSFVGAKNLQIHGNGCKLLFSGPIKMLYMHECENVSIDGFVVDYSPKPFIKATLTAVDKENGTMDFDSQEDVGLTANLTLPEWWFAFPNRADLRRHYFIREYQKISELKYRLVIAQKMRHTLDFAEVGEEFLLPHVSSSHFVGALCTITYCNGFSLKNIRIFAHPEFGFDVRSNRGNMCFEGIALKPREDAAEKIVSWRDGFHIKDNLDPIVWNNCYIGALGDDAFNLSCVHLDVTQVSEDGKEIHAYPAEKGATREINKNDEFVAYDLETGNEIGRGFAEKSFNSKTDVHFLSDTAMPLLKKGMQISFYKFANPGFVVKNSYIEGTVRVRSSGTFENCKFNVFWVRIENEFFVEGPIPRDITFRNCEFTTPYDPKEAIFFVGTIGKNGLTSCKYKCTNIVLDNCTFVKGTYYAEEGNELIIK